MAPDSHTSGSAKFDEYSPAVSLRQYRRSDQDRFCVRPARRATVLAGFPRCEAPRVRIAVSHFSISFTLSTDSQASYFFDLAVQADREVAKVPI